ncbi:hypothetical protein CK203_111032 [Vitis vinifera]|uniref:Uncharacterized protein n=1 Tax=Vitis vinifera TaxID=29760 RepID=A0A438CQS2_VITVI|nr:hypothetical protein CK203_111032 [Vitis vinifera]
MCPDEIWGSDSGTRVTLCFLTEEESADDAAPASPFSYAELEVKLKQITPDWKPSSPLLRSGEGPPQHVSTTRSFYSAAADCRLYEDLLLSAPRD